MKNIVKPQIKLRAFTLTEVLIAASIGTVVIAGVMQMTITLGRMNFDSVAKLGINRDVRSFTNQLTLAARSTRDFRVYTSTDNLQERQSGQTGDLLVLVWGDTQPVDEATAQVQDFYYRRVIAFARVREDATNNTGPVIRYEQQFPAPGSGGTLLRASQTTIRSVTQALLDPSNINVTRREVLELTRGLANEQLFFYSRIGRSIIVNGEIFHGNRAREVTNTYNFTITPRG